MVWTFIQEEEGATSIEYGLIASLIALAIVASFQFVAEANSANYQRINEAVEGAVNGP